MLEYKATNYVSNTNPKIIDFQKETIGKAVVNLA